MSFTTVTDWSIIKVTNDKNVVISQHLYGIIVNNTIGLFDVDDFICTSNIKHIDTINCKAITQKGDTYILDGEGDDFVASLTELEELSKGATPFSICINRMLDCFDNTRFELKNEGCKVLNSFTPLNTDAEELLGELDRIRSRAKEMFREFKQINLEPAAVKLSGKNHDVEHPMKQLYKSGRMDAEDLYLRLSEARTNCESIGNFVDYIENKISDPELKILDDAYQYIVQNDDSGTFSDMLNLYHEVMMLYRLTRKVLNKLNNTPAEVWN